MMNVSTVGDLNDVITSGEMNDLILVSEALQEKKIAQIAEQIVSDKKNRIVLIAGPSSSGKTTFSHRLSIQLRAHGVCPHPIPVDDYFVNRENTPKDENGDYNYECLGALDVDLFNEHMSALLNGDTVELPQFNFITGKREFKGRTMHIGPEDILVIEGIHGLNDRLTYSLHKDSKFKIYISALTQLNIDEHNRISTTDRPSDPAALSETRQSGAVRQLQQSPAGILSAAARRKISSHIRKAPMLCLTPP